MINYIIAIVIIIPTVYILYGQIKRVGKGKCSFGKDCSSCTFKDSCDDEEEK